MLSGTSMVKMVESADEDTFNYSVQGGWKLEYNVHHRRCLLAKAGLTTDQRHTVEKALCIILDLLWVNDIEGLIDDERE